MCHWKTEFTLQLFGLRGHLFRDVGDLHLDSGSLPGDNEI